MAAPLGRLPSVREVRIACLVNLFGVAGGKFEAALRRCVRSHVGFGRSMGRGSGGMKGVRARTGE